MGQPVDATRFWRPIPPIPSYDLGDQNGQNQLVVFVSDERLYANKHSGLSKWSSLIGVFMRNILLS